MGSNSAGPDSSAPLPEECTNLLRNFLIHTAECYFLHDSEGRIFDVNEAACANLGYTRDELLDLNVCDLEQRFQPAELKERWNSLQPGRSYRFDGIHRRKNGSILTVTGISQRFGVSTGSLIAVLIHPVFGPMEAEGAPQAPGVPDHAGYLQLQRAQILAQLGTWQWNARADQMNWDDVMCAVHGYTMEDYPRTLPGCLDIVHPDDRAAVEQAVQRSLAERSPFDIDYKIIPPGGDMRYVHARGYISDVDAEGAVNAMFGIVQDISERKRLEKVVAQNEARFRMLVEQSPDAFYLHDLQGHILDVSPRTCEHLGYSREELLALNVCDIETHFSPADLREAWRTMIPGRQALFAGIHRRCDGSEFPVEIHNRRFEIDGEPRVLALVHDVSGQQRLARLMEVTLRSTARHSGTDFLQLLVRELAEVLQLELAFVSRVIDPKLERLRIVAMWRDGQYSDALEYEVRGTPCERVFAEGLVTVPRDAQTCFPQDTWLKQQGIQSYVAIAFYDIAGTPLGHLGIMHNAPLEDTDVIEAALRVFACRAAAEIERMRFQTELRDRERQLEILADVGKRLNSELTVQQVMRTLIYAGQKLTGATAGAWGLLQNEKMVFTEYQRGADISHIAYQFGPHDGVPGFVLTSRRACFSNDPANDPRVRPDVHEALGFTNLANVPIISKTGSMLGCFELHNKPGEGFETDDLDWLQTLADAAAVALENAQLLEDVRKSRSELEQRVAERTSELALANRELEAFSYSVSHDLRAPLRIIEGFSQELMEEHAAELGATAKDYVNRIARATARMKEITEALLNLSRIIRAPLARQPVDFSALVAEIADAVQSYCASRPVKTDIQPGVIARGDAQMLRVALTNLLENACKFSTRAPAPEIRFGSLIKDGETCYYVSDNGVGFDMQFAERLFKPFQRLHHGDEFEGLGIGLATVQRIIHRHGGRVWAEGRPGQGATFYFTLPG